MKEKLQEIYEGLRERLKSPFLLTFIVVWAIHNWEFVYAILTFNTEMPYFQRIAFLKAYLFVYKYDKLLWFPLAWTFVSIGIYFLGSFLSEGINLIYNKWIRTWLYLTIDKNKLKTEDDYNSLDLRRKKLQELVFDLRRKEEDAALKLKNVEEILNKTISEQRDELAGYLKETTEREKLIFDKDIEIENAKKEITIAKEFVENTKFSVDILKEQNEEYKDLKKWMVVRAPELLRKWENKDGEVDSDDEIKEQTDLQKFRNLFAGTWLNYFQEPGKLTGQETFTLGNDNGQLAFITGNKSILLISRIRFLNDNTLTFTKTNKHAPNNPMKNILTINNSSSLSGTENTTINIRYSKVGP